MAGTLGTSPRAGLPGHDVARVSLLQRREPRLEPDEVALEGGVRSGASLISRCIMPRPL